MPLAWGWTGRSCPDVIEASLGGGQKIAGAAGLPTGDLSQDLMCLSTDVCWRCSRRGGSAPGERMLGTVPGGDVSCLQRRPRWLLWPVSRWPGRCWWLRGWVPHLPQATPLPGAPTAMGSWVTTPPPTQACRWRSTSAGHWPARRSPRSAPGSPIRAWWPTARPTAGATAPSGSWATTPPPTRRSRSR